MVTANAKSLKGLALKPKLSCVAVASALALAHAAAGAVNINENVTLSGFGSLAWVQTDSDAGLYRREFQPKGADSGGSALVDSNFGMQISVKALPWLSGTVQTLTTQRTTSRMNTRFEWAYAKATPIDGLSVRGGQMSLPNFMVSDSRRVGYANNTLRPANEVYGLDLLNGGLRGLDASYRIPVAGESLVLTGLTGKSTITTPGRPTTQVNNLRGLNLLWEADGYSIRLGRVEGKPVVNPASAALLPAGTDLTKELYSFTGAGFTVDHRNVVLQGESVQRRAELFGFIIDANAWYLMGGYRLGSFLPYLQYSEVKSANGSSVAPQDTAALGVRWDAFSSAAVKLQLERVNTNGTAGQSFVTPNAIVSGRPVPLPVPRPVTTLGVSIDFVF